VSEAILVVGVGGEGPASLPPALRVRISAADQLWGSERLLTEWAGHPAEKVIVKTNLDDLIDRLRMRGAARVVILASGDPGFYGIAGTLLRYFASGELEIIPQPTSLQWAFARAGISWSDAILASAHARPLAEVLAWAKRAPKLGILTDSQHTPALIAQRLLEAGSQDCRAIVAENLGLPNERLTDTRLSALPGLEFTSLNVMLLLRDPGWRPAPGFAPRPDEAYVHRRGLISKADVRALSLARLALRETDIAWDIGAGSGAMSIEMAELAWRGQVYAIERDLENLEYIRENLRLFGALNVTVVSGEAPHALEALPRPAAVFIGGSGGRMKDILCHLQLACASGCRVVANLATLENLNAALVTMRELNWETELCQVNLAHGKAIAGLMRLAPLNPVFILSGERPE
jgi:precorrin-6Y C5,15-methyltransferase (decarboxylating)